MGTLWPNFNNASAATAWPTIRMPASSPMPSAMAAPLMPVMPPSNALGSRQPTLLGSYTSPAGFPVSVYALANGHQVVIESSPIDIVSMRTFVNAGSIVERPIRGGRSPLYPPTNEFAPGISHLDEHCHFLTTAQHPIKNSWAAEVDSLAGNYNASTSEELIQHELHGNATELPQFIRLHGESVMRPLYRPADITQEKTNVRNEMKLRKNQPGNKIFDRTMALMFDRPGFQTLGEDNDVLQVTPEALQRYHQAYYSPTNMVTVISGRVSPDQVLPLLDREFGGNPPRVRPDYQAALHYAIRPGEVRHATVFDPQFAQGSVVNLSLPAPPKVNPANPMASLKERVAMELLTSLLVGPPYEFLVDQIQNKQRLASGIGVEYSPLKGAGLVNIALQTTPGQEQQALRAALSSLGMLPQWLSQIPPEQFVQRQQTMIHAFQKSVEHAEDRTFQMGEAALGKHLPYYLNYPAIVQSLTLQDVIAVAQKYMNPQTYAVVFGVTGPVSSKPQGGIR